MSTLQEIEAAIEKLPAAKVQELRRWLDERWVDDWDAKMEADAAAGKFDALRARVREDDAAGKCGEL